MERSGQVTRVLTNYGQLDTGGTEWLERKVKPSLSGTSRVTGDSQARFCERLGVKFPGPTRPGLDRPRQTLRAIIEFLLRDTSHPKRCRELWRLSICQSLHSQFVFHRILRAGCWFYKSVPDHRE